MARIAGKTRADAAMFRAAFPGEPSPITLDNIVKAIASFERTLVSGDFAARSLFVSRRSQRGMSPQAERGMKLFFSRTTRVRATATRASTCRAPWIHEGSRECGARVPQHRALQRRWARIVSGCRSRAVRPRRSKPDDMGRFRAPTLRNIAVTAPYMHDGSVRTLDAAVAALRVGRAARARSGANACRDSACLPPIEPISWRFWNA